MLQAVLQVGDDFVRKTVSSHLTTELCVQAVRSKVTSAGGEGEGRGRRGGRRGGKGGEVREEGWSGGRKGVERKE